MTMTSTNVPLHEIEADAIVVAIGGSELSGPAQELNERTLCYKLEFWKLYQKGNCQ